MHKPRPCFVVAGCKAFTFLTHFHWGVKTGSVQSEVQSVSINKCKEGKTDSPTTLDHEDLAGKMAHLLRLRHVPKQASSSVGCQVGIVLTREMEKVADVAPNRWRSCASCPSDCRTLLFPPPGRWCFWWGLFVGLSVSRMAQKTTSPIYMSLGDGV